MFINAGRTFDDIVWSNSLNWHSGCPGNCRELGEENGGIWRSEGPNLEHSSATCWVSQHASPLFPIYKHNKCLHCWSLNEIVNIALVETPVGFCFIIFLYKWLSLSFHKQTED